MTTTKTLTQAEIEQAIVAWLTAKFLKVKPKTVYMWRDPGDTPVSGPQIFAKVEIEEAA